MVKKRKLGVFKIKPINFFRIQKKIEGLKTEIKRKKMI